MSCLLSMQSVIGIILEIVVIGIILVCGFIGLKKGFLQSVLSLFTNFAVLLVSVFTAKYGALVLDKLFGFVGFMGKQMGKVLAKVADGALATVFSDGATVADANAIIDGTGLFGPLKTLLKKAVAQNSNDLVGNSIANIGGKALGAIIAMIVAGIIIFLLLKLILFLLSKLFENLTANKILGTPDKILGLVLGFVKGGLIIFVYGVVLVILTLIPTVNDFVSPIINEHTFVTKGIYKLTDNFVEKNVIDNIDDWINKLWENRNGDSSSSGVTSDGKADASGEVSANMISKMPPLIVDVKNN